MFVKGARDSRLPLSFTMTSNRPHSVSNQRRLNCVFNNHRADSRWGSMPICWGGWGPPELVTQNIFPIPWRHNAGLILGLHPANERRRYKVTPSLISWVQTIISAVMAMVSSLCQYLDVESVSLQSPQGSCHTGKRCKRRQNSHGTGQDKGLFKFLHLHTNVQRVQQRTKTWNGMTQHYDDVIMGAMASQITSLTIVYSTVYSGVDQRNTKAPRHWPLWGESTSDRWIPRTKGQLTMTMTVTRKMFLFHDVIML